MAPLFEQEIALDFSFHAFRNDDLFETVSQANHRFHKRFLLPSGSNVVYKGRIDFNNVDRKML